MKKQKLILTIRIAHQITLDPLDWTVRVKSKSFDTDVTILELHEFCIKHGCELGDAQISIDDEQ